MSPIQQQNHVHPLAPLTEVEILHSSQLIKSQHPNDSVVFKTITLAEPPKDQMIVYLDAEHAGYTPPAIDRKSFINYYLGNNDILHDAVINLTSNIVESTAKLGALVHGPGDGDEMMLVDKIVSADPQVKEAFDKLKLPKGTIMICEPWTYGSDGVNDERRQFQCFMFARDPSNAEQQDYNHYAFPLPFSPVVDIIDQVVTRIDVLPTGSDENSKELGEYEMRSPNEYIPEAQKLRDDLKPLNIVQPEGASFTVLEGEGSGGIIKWQRWHFRFGFNAREGMVLYDIRYDNRPLFYRLSLSDMNIPYADPRGPYHRKAAFDLGDAGAGVTANNLELGCDCLGSIYYHSAVISDAEGKAAARDNCICVHEQDAGIGWKHTNFRTNRAVVTRNRQLVLQSIITVANYEYILAFVFNQAGELTYEVRATGILSTQPIDRDITVPWGTVVHPGVLAAHHQHFFSLRVDPMIDGHSNTLVTEEATALPRSKLNPHGTGYIATEAPISVSGGYDLDTSQNRVFKIQNRNKLNAVNRKPVGYKIMVPDFQKMLADKVSFHHKRAEFADHNIYVTKYRENELYSAGQYTNQSRGGTGVRSWADRKDSIVDEDIVVWVQFGINHIPRIEDFPVMPCELISVHLKPANFFERSPAIDVPASSQQLNKSVQVAALTPDNCCTTRTGKVLEVRNKS